MSETNSKYSCLIESVLYFLLQHVRHASSAPHLTVFAESVRGRPISFRLYRVLRCRTKKERRQGTREKRRDNEKTKNSGLRTMRSRRRHDHPSCTEDTQWNFIVRGLHRSSVPGRDEEQRYSNTSKNAHSARNER